MVESVGSMGGGVKSVGKAVVNGMGNYLSATHTDNRHRELWECGISS